MSDERTCSNCRIPLDAVVSVTDGRCSDEIACNIRKEALAMGGGYLLTPEGVTRIDPIGEEPGHGYWEIGDY